MKITKYLITAGLALSLVGCGNEAEVSDNNTSIEESDTSSVETIDKEVEKDVASDSNNTVTITDNHGEVEVPKNPKKVVALDSRNYEVLEAMGVDLVAAPKDVMPATSSYLKDEKVENIGDHREPNLELIAAADPDLVIVGQRFGDYYDDIKELVPNASVIDLNTDVSEEAESPGNNLLEGFINSTTILGEIFDKEEKANELIADLEESIEKAKNAYKGGSVMGVITSGGEIGYSAPKYGRVWGPIYEILNLEPSLEVNNDSSDHKGDDISVEAIAESKPDYLMVLDRDAGISTEESAKPAKEVLEASQALKDLDVIKNDKIYYAPNDTYTNESIITYTEIFNGLAELFTK
ncbi:siderophore ABC transporter substrate-binding protein [Anaerococcus cruorum]|uniref:siderophore ABC transporter substrate-binding protein n=1 Tax=Anaerococcus sp. WGS1596 TaxID=3366806 RepID=UPI00372D55FE